LPIDMYVGTDDECGFYAPMVQLEKDLQAVGHTPLAELTVFRGGGHCCSPLVDEHLIRGKILLMMARSWPAFQMLRLDAHTAPNANEIQNTLKIFSHALGLSAHSDASGALLVSSGNTDSHKPIEVMNKPPRIPVPVECTDRAMLRTPKREQRSLTPVRNVIATPRAQRSLTPMRDGTAASREQRSLTPVRNRTPARQRSLTPARTPPSRMSDRTPQSFTPPRVQRPGGGLHHFHYLPQNLQGECIAAHA